MRLAVALVHHPVLDRGGAVVTTAITNLDLHDIARSARAYGAEKYYVVHPVAAQRTLVDRIRAHWIEGSGKERIPDRADALALLRTVPSLEDACADLGGGAGRAGIEVWTTAASARGGPVTTFADARARLEASRRGGVSSSPARSRTSIEQAGAPVMIVFGTGWGLAPEIVASADVHLEPIRAASETGFNHLSVRAACAIALDRLLGAPR